MEKAVQEKVEAIVNGVDFSSGDTQACPLCAKTVVGVRGLRMHLYRSHFGMQAGNGKHHRHEEIPQVHFKFCPHCGFNLELAQQAMALAERVPKR